MVIVQGQVIKDQVLETDLQPTGNHLEHTVLFTQNAPSRF